MSSEMGQTILCIDDDHDTLAYHRVLLERSGYLVLTASSARRGLEIARTSAISLVLVDYHMPEMTGSEVADAIKHMKLNVPVVMVSSDKEIPEAVLGTVDGFVSKDEVGNLLLPVVLSFCGANSPAPHESIIATDRI